MKADSKLRRSAEIQGFDGLTSQDLATVGPWLRFTPALNFVANTVGTLFASIPVLLGLAVLMLAGTVSAAHPWDHLYNQVVRPFTGTRALPPSGWRRRLTFGLGFGWLVATAWAFSSGKMILAYALGGTMSALVLSLATVHFCIVSEIIDLLVGQRGRGQCG